MRISPRRGTGIGTQRSDPRFAAYAGTSKEPLGIWSVITSSQASLQSSPTRIPVHSIMYSPSCVGCLSEWIAMITRGYSSALITRSGIGGLLFPAALPSRC